MNLKNNFSDETRALFIWNDECWWCGRNGQNALHHILGRISNSPLNACPLHNDRCHIGNGMLATFDVQTRLLEKQYNYLMDNGYVLDDDDRDFIKKNKRHYSKFLKI